jgi:hypothetical protein
MKMSAVLVHLALYTGTLIACLTYALAAPPADVAPNSTLSEWFKSLRQPGTSVSCCSISDCRRVDFRIVTDGGYEVMVEGEWYRVPDRFVLQQKGNQAGKAVACYTTVFGYGTLTGAVYGADRIEILCFVPESPTS